MNQTIEEDKEQLIKKLKTTIEKLAQDPNITQDSIKYKQLTDSVNELKAALGHPTTETTESFLSFGPSFVHKIDAGETQPDSTLEKVAKGIGAGLLSPLSFLFSNHDSELSPPTQAAVSIAGKADDNGTGE